MSNNSVGEVYARVIQEVVDTSLIDFEEAGIASATLEDLKNLWQRKLTNTGVAHFPWDPAPPPSAQLDAPVNKKGSQNAQMKKEAGVMAQHASQQQQGEPRIKAEPGTEKHEISAPPAGTYGPDVSVAQQRANQAIQARFGTNAVNKFNSQQQNLQQGQQNGAPRPGLMLPGISAMQQPPQPPQPRVNGQNGIPQHDGADDDMDYGNITKEEADGVILKSIQDAEKQNAELYDALQSLSVTSKIKQTKGKTVRKSKQRRLDAYQEALSGDSDYPHPSATPVPTFRHVAGPSQLDGPGSMEPEEDEDAINSALDDSEDDEINNDDEDETQQIMLCMYDKVQRTKNKWKCVLKDGVLTINGKEYVFHKATGEYEW